VITQSAPRESTPVLVVGAGPAGLVSSLLLSQQQIHHVLVEKYAGMAHTPRAHIINQRTVEILRDLDLEDEFYKIAMPWELMSNTVWHLSLAGTELARRQSWGTSPADHADYVRASPCEMANCGQHLLEPFLLDAVRRSPYADVRLNHEFLGLEQDAGGVTARLTNRPTDEQIVVRSDYLVGADGGRSAVAAAIGLRYIGDEGISASATIHFHADLERFTRYRPGTLYWNATPGSGNFRGSGTLICHQPWHDWALAFSYRPEAEDPLDESLAVARLHKLIGDDSVQIDIKNISSWTINRLVAEQYSLGRVFCMGDAVHRHPPTNGLGLNTSVADAYNLAWKLAHVIRGHAGAQLLSTYSAERQPVGQQVVNRAFASIGDMARITEALGFNDYQSETDGITAFARLQEPGPVAAQRRQDLISAVAGTDYQFNAHGVEVGYRYRSGARVDDGCNEPAPVLDPDLFYQPTTWPGAHLPHAWLDDGAGRRSTYDFAGRGSFTLFTGIGGDAWSGAAADVAAQTGIELIVHSVGTPGGLIDCYGDWRRLSEVPEDGCVLVRPDLFVAWRAFSAAPESVSRLADVIASVLGRPSNIGSIGDNA
jgi:2,4-dichlorophenol 6-monooxygenase